MNFYKKLGEIRPNQLITTYGPGSIMDAKKSLVSSANLSYHGIQGNIEMGFLIKSHEKAKQIEEVMKEMVRMKVFGKYK